MISQDGRFVIDLSQHHASVWIDSIRLAGITREIVLLSNNPKDKRYHVASIRIESITGTLSWRLRETKSVVRTESASVFRMFPLHGVLDGLLKLPGNSLHPTSTGRGFFEAPNVVRAYQTWRDTDVEAGWKVVTEVDPDVPEGLRPLLAALPLLFFSHLP